MADPSLTLVVPAFDEAARIAPFLETVGGWARARHGIEVIVVDDGSSDATVATAEGFAGRIEDLRVISLGGNQGKGAAVRRGLAEGCGGYRVFLDADGSTPVNQVDLLLAAADGRDDVVVIGSTAIVGSRIGRDQVAVRQLLGRVGNRVVQRLLVPGVHDTQRGCKLVSARWCREVLPRCTVDGWAFDVELLARSEAAGYEIVEVPVTWNHVPGSKVRLSSYLQSLRDVVRTWRDLRREGPPPAPPAPHRSDGAADRPVGTATPT